jgi:hypothetical protein
VKETGHRGYHERMADYNNTAISWMGLKDAMLYFPHVVPFGPGYDLLLERIKQRESDISVVEPGLAERLTSAIETDLIPPGLRSKGFFKELNAIGAASLPFILEHVESQIDEREVLVEHEMNFAKAIATFFHQYPQLRSVPLIIDHDFAVQEKNEGQDVSITLASLRLIDSEAITWDQLIEFRKDKETLSKLRRFRIFAHQNYLGKSPAFVEDDLLTRMEDYKIAVKKFGFATKSATLTTLFDSKLVLAGLAGSFLAAYMQAPILTLGTTGITIGKIAIELRKATIGKQELMANHPVSYVTYAKEKLKDKQNETRTCD